MAGRLIARISGWLAARVAVRAYRLGRRVERASWTRHLADARERVAVDVYTG